MSCATVKNLKSTNNAHNTGIINNNKVTFMMSLEESKEVPSIKTISVREGYNQTYIIYPKNEKTGDKDEGSDEYHEVFFRCGNWCYKGPIDFGDVKIETSEIQVLIPTLQKQQNSLKFFCGSSR